MLKLTGNFPTESTTLAAPPDDAPDPPPACILWWVSYLDLPDIGGGARGAGVGAVLAVNLGGLVEVGGVSVLEAEEATGLNESPKGSKCSLS